MLLLAELLPAQIFNNYTVVNGLPDNHVKSIVQDNNSFIWFATLNGLARYDGYEFRKFKHEPDNPASLSNDAVWILLQGKSGCIWIGTRSGDLNKYDPQKNSFEHWNICSSDDEENYISCLYEDYESNVWIGTYNKGLYKFNPADKSVTRWQHNESDSNSISNDFINAIKRDNNGNLWIGTYSGLNKFNPQTHPSQFIKYFSKPSNPNTLSNNLIWNITPSKLDPYRLYIGTYNGVSILDLRTNNFTRLLPAKHAVNQFSNSIGSLIEQKEGNETELWLGGYGGLIKYSLISEKSDQWFHNHRIPESLASNQINDLMMDSSGVIWIATEDGVSSLPKKILKFKKEVLRYAKDADRKILGELEIHAFSQVGNGDIFIGSSDGLRKVSLKGNQAVVTDIPQFHGIDVWSLEKGNNGCLWIGTYGNGLYNYNFKTSKVNPVSFKPPNDRATPYNYVKTIYQDDRERLWVGFWGGGLSLIDLKSGSQRIFRKESENYSGITFNDVWKIYQDAFGRVWIGTNGGGLNYYDERNNRFLRIQGSDMPISNNVLSICQQYRNVISENTILWIGTTEGLFRITLKNIYNFENLQDIISDIKRYANLEGLTNEVISDIVEDENHNLWMTSNFGLSQFAASEEIFLNFSSSDGLTGADFSEGALLKDQQGFIFAGGSQGLNIFKPEDIKLSNFKRNVVFTDFLLQNKRVPINENSPLVKEITYTSGIKLRYDQNSFTLYFSSSDYNASHFIEYSHILEGFDAEWSYPESRNYVSYTNLDPGEYTLKVKATNSDRVWNNNVSQLTLFIAPPWWKTSWAYAVYILMITAGLLAIRKFQITRAELRNELKMREFEARKHFEVENLKSRFFANLSHEFRTPLLLMKGPLDELITSRKDSGDENLNQHLDMIQRNSDKLGNLIDQLLELSQLENASIPVKARKDNILTVIKGLAASFDSLALQKNIKLVTLVPEMPLTVWFDRDKLEKVFNNLLSNAFKFTPSGGVISVSIIMKDTSEYIEIKIVDTGIGIPEDQLDKIFNRFYQVDDSNSRAFGGSGIGLALVKELVELHKWNIRVESEPGRGTEFTLFIPAGDYLEENEMVNENKSHLIGQYVPVGDVKLSGQLSDNVIQNSMEEPILGSDAGGISILLVEDSEDVRKYLNGLISSWNDFITSSEKIRIVEAENGQEGLIAAYENLPDIIISDVMMPYMDGIEFCKQVKSRWETSHIPVILLTAKASDQSKLEGLENGADEYLTKPFNSRELFARIRNLLLQRKMLKERFSREIKLSYDTDKDSAAEDEFLLKVRKVVELNLSDLEFGIEALAEQMFLSRSQLHRRLVAAAGISPGEFIRISRLKHAAKLILEKDMSITQVCFEVGFNSPSHFTKAFSQHFNCLPSEFYSAVKEGKIF